MTEVKGMLPIYDVVLGPYDQDNGNKSYLGAANTLLHSQMTLDDLIALQETFYDPVTDESYPDLPQDETEVRVSLEGIGDILQGDFTKIFAANTLTNWPIYQRMMQDPVNGAHRTRGRALMIGSSSLLSSVAFGKLAEQVYGTRRSVVTDIVGGKQKTHSGNFVFGDGLHLPFKSNSFTVVHTDRLLPWLVDSTRTIEDFHLSVFELSKEIGRVLRHGGQVFMNEAAPTMETTMSVGQTGRALELISRLLEVALNDNGIWSVHGQAQIPNDVAFWHDPTRNLDAYESTYINTISVYGRKDRTVRNPQASFT